MNEQPHVKRLTQAHQAQFAKWEREREEYVKEHGLAAWDQKVEREIRVLYPEEGQL